MSAYRCPLHDQVFSGDAVTENDCPLCAHEAGKHKGQNISGCDHCVSLHALAASEFALAADLAQKAKDAQAAADIAKANL